MEIDYTQVLAQQGWQCPVCKRVLAPFVPECPCGGQGLKTYTTINGSTTPTKKYKVVDGKLVEEE